MTAERLVFESVGSAAPGATTGTLAVVGETGAGWFVDAAPVEETTDIVHRTVPRAREAWRSELLVRTEDYYRNRYLPGAPFPTGRTRP